MKKLRAEVSIVPEGDLGHDCPSGMRPSFNLGDEPITSVVDSARGEKSFAKGTAYEVVITLPYGEILGGQLRAGAPFVLQVGGRKLGSGKILEVLQ
jgi:hypothetical protein